LHRTKNAEDSIKGVLLYVHFCLMQTDEEPC
jgi:hypothetical protein